MLTRYDVTTEEKGDYVHVRIAGTEHNIKAFMNAIQEWHGTMFSKPTQEAFTRRRYY